MTPGRRAALGRYASTHHQEIRERGRRLRAARKAARLCKVCGAPAWLGLSRCEACTMRHRSEQRERDGYQAWRPNDPGRTPTEHRLILPRPSAADPQAGTRARLSDELNSGLIPGNPDRRGRLPRPWGAGD
jgi:hypothetical protein